MFLLFVVLYSVLLLHCIITAWFLLIDKSWWCRRGVSGVGLVVGSAIPPPPLPPAPFFGGAFLVVMPSAERRGMNADISKRFALHNRYEYSLSILW